MKKVNIIFVIILMLLLSAFVVNATLVDSEDFESYTPNVAVLTLITESAGKWNCSSPSYYPSCGYIGGGDGSYDIEIQERTNPTSQFLRLTAIDGGGANFPRVDLKWNNINSTVGSYYNFSMKYQIKLFDWSCNDTSPFAYYEGYFTMYDDGQYVNQADTDYRPRQTIGKVFNSSILHNAKLRPIWHYDGSPHLALPNIANAPLTDFGWHDIVVHYEFNSTEHMTEVRHYMDGVLQHTVSDIIDVNRNYGSWTYPFFDDIIFKSNMCFDVGIDNIELHEDVLIPYEEEEEVLLNCTIVNCSTWSDPYYLREEFNGQLHLCDWATTENLCFYEKMDRDLNQTYYSMFKTSDLLTETNSRYFTVGFDLKPEDISSSGYIAISLYDYDYQRFIQFLVGENSEFFNNDGGSSVSVYDNVSSSLSKKVELHIDFTEDDFDLYYDGSKVASSLGFSNSFLDITNFYGIRISSSLANFDLDNLEVYVTDQDNTIIASEEPIVAPVDETESMCGLFKNVIVECTIDSDCETDSCNVNGKCNRFDMTYCDENGHKRGNGCLVSAVSYCALDKTSDIILDNFLLFLVFIIMIIFFGYVIWIIKK